ncbi:unnamed protein product [Orchesella dallaii]|uniref:Uncharacterized protein n=1 Tax=Orchesella dallaii TaxID=48710 RepID=A0ABP1R1E4_9HEXA
MVQTEKSDKYSCDNMLTLNSNSTDPFARKEMGQSRPCAKSSVTTPMSSNQMKGAQAPPSFQSASSKTTSGSASKPTSGQYGSWGPTFKNKDHFASLHFC